MPRPLASNSSALLVLAAAHGQLSANLPMMHTGNLYHYESTVEPEVSEQYRWACNFAKLEAFCPQPTYGFLYGLEDGLELAVQSGTWNL